MHDGTKTKRTIDYVLKCLLSLVSLTAGLAHGGVIDPNDFASGSLLTGNTPGALITHISHHGGESFLSTGAVFALKDPSCEISSVCAAPTGTNVLSSDTSPLPPHNWGLHVTGNLVYWEHVPRTTDFFGEEFLESAGYFSAIRLDFDEPVDYLSVDYFSLAGDPFGLFLFDSSGELLDLVRWIGYDEMRPIPSQPISWYVNSRSLQRETADIAFVVMGGTQSASGVGRIAYSVPEPGALGLFGASLLMLLLIRRKRPT